MDEDRCEYCGLVDDIVFLEEMKDGRLAHPNCRANKVMWNAISELRKELEALRRSIRAISDEMPV